MTIGRQVNFFMSDDDQAELARRLDALGEVVATLPPFPTTKFSSAAVSKYARWNSGEHPAVLFRPADTNRIVLRHISPERGYAVDLFQSPVVEFWRCIMTNEYIQRGRVYYIPGYIEDDGSKIMKSKEFIDMAQKVFKIVKKMCVERRDFLYIAKDALAREKLGYNLVTK